MGDPEVEYDEKEDEEAITNSKIEKSPKKKRKKDRAPKCYRRTMNERQMHWIRQHAVSCNNNEASKYDEKNDDQESNSSRTGSDSKISETLAQTWCKTKTSKTKHK